MDDVGDWPCVDMVLEERVLFSGLHDVIYSVPIEFLLCGPQAETHHSDDIPNPPWVLVFPKGHLVHP